jgi:DNA-directed RNA polymerase subunit RPC12/RpoP
MKHKPWVIIDAVSLKWLCSDCKESVITIREKGKKLMCPKCQTKWRS